jgi:hypothetical protein
MGYSVKAISEKAKPAGEFVAGIIAIAAVLYALSWVVDDVLVHVHIHADHQWWAYRIWHTWWVLIVPLGMVGIGWRYSKRTLGDGLWAFGIIWLAFYGCAAGMVLFFDVFSHLSDRVGFLGGTILSCAGVLVLGLGFVVVGRLVDRVRGRLSR